MKEYRILLADLMLELTECLEERLALYITDGSSDFYDCNLGIVTCVVAEKAALNLVGDVRDNLNRSSAEISTALL